MNTIARTGLAFAAAAAVPAAVTLVPYAAMTLTAYGQSDEVYAWMQVRSFGMTAFLVSLGHVIILGAPAFVFLQLRQLVTWWSSVSVGFIAACVPLSLWAWLVRYPEAQQNYAAGGLGGDAASANAWSLLSSLLSIGSVGLLGAIGGLSFWFVWQALRPNQWFKPTVPPPLRSSGPAT